jgi:integrase
MLGTSARIGEVLAIRRRDVDITSAVPSIRLAGTIVSRNGEPTFRQDHPKTAKSRRIVALPSFASDAVRRRLANAGRLELDSLLFQSRDGTPLTTANVRRQLRRVLGGVGIAGVTPHMFRRTVATAVNDNADVELAAELLGHTDTRVTVMHYIQRRELVNPETAALLDRGRGVSTVLPRWQDRAAASRDHHHHRTVDAWLDSVLHRDRSVRNRLRSSIGGKSLIERVHNVPGSCG